MYQIGYRLFLLALVMVLYIGTSAQSNLEDSLVNYETLQTVEKSNYVNLDISDVVIPNIVERPNVEYAWVFFVVVLVLILVGLIRAFGLANHQLAIKSGFVNVASKFEQLDKELGVNLITVLQSIVSSIVITLGVFLLQPFQFNIGVESSLVAFLVVLLAFILAYSFKYFMHYIVGLVLQSEDLAKMMVINLVGMLYAFTLLVFPLIVVWYYAPLEGLKGLIVIVLGIGLVIFLCWRLVKSVLIYYQYFPFAKIYIIIYLCTLEITPLLVLMKLIA